MSSYGRRSEERSKTEEVSQFWKGLKSEQRQLHFSKPPLLERHSTWEVPEFHFPEPKSSRSYQEVLSTPPLPCWLFCQKRISHELCHNIWKTPSAQSSAAELMLWGEVYSAPNPFSHQGKWETYRSLPYLSSWHVPGFSSKEIESREGMMCN